ncbi:MAG: hypothetical protein LBL70_05250 [Treponema sp.]|nr:hypothetical protein [Treponema sp.]
MVLRGNRAGKWGILFFFFLIFAFSAGAESQNMFPAGMIRTADTERNIFPSLYFSDYLGALRGREDSSPYWVYTEAEMKSAAPDWAGFLSPLLNNDILAFYGHPNSRNMGILGRYPIEELDTRLGTLAKEYAAVNGGRGVRKAFYIIYGTVWPEGEIGILGEPTLLRYIEYALAHDILIFLDHQIGRYDPVKSLERMLPYLRYPNVHLALDPEWRTAKPMKEIGSVTADEINRAQQAMEEYLVANKLPGERMLVIHQFKPWMINSRPQVLSNFSRVRLIHCADGFGNPNQKRVAYASNAEALNIPVKAFKLFYNFNIPGAGYDSPLLSPEEVYTLNPRPYVIMYQ